MRLSHDLRGTRPGWAVPMVAIMAALATACISAYADDWPTYAHDNARSSVTPETVSFPLAQQWSYQSPSPPAPGWGDPHNTPVEGVQELNKVKFDDVYHVTSAGDAMYFASTVDNSVHCREATTGKERWRFFTGGPVRLAPTVHEGKVYFGSDDGYVYCLRASDGTVAWQMSPAPVPRRVLGHGRMISMWPVRTGVLVDDDTAYFAAGIFPTERIYLRAVNAQDGSELWRNDTVGDRSAGREDLSPQGYLLASDEDLYVPSGRSLPACFAREDGRFKFKRSFSRWQTGAVGGTYASLGGSYALLYGDHLFVGTEFVAGYDAASGNLGFAWFPGRKLIVTAETSYMLSDNGITTLDRIAYPALSRKRRDLDTKLQNARASKAEDKAEQVKKIQAERDKVLEDIAGCTAWTYEAEDLETMVLAGNCVIAGGRDIVMAIDRATGKELWKAPVQGAAKGLALANGRLYVSTTTGAIHVFGAGPAPAAAATPAQAGPLPTDALTRQYRQIARNILQQTGVKQGYCLMLGCGDGRLAYELANNSDLTVYCVSQDAEQVAAARKNLSALGLYGSRVVVDYGSLDELPYSDYFANLIVSYDTLMEGKLNAPASEAMRVLKPCGGVLYVGQYKRAGVPMMAQADLNAWLQSGEIEGAQIVRNGGLFANYVRGSLPGAGQWTHQYGDAGNTASSADTAVKCPLEVLWYGEPGPNKVPSRHAGNQAPLTINGRVFLEGINELMCFDAYNGFIYWDRKLQGAFRTGMIRECGNLTCDETSIYVAAGAQCLRLDQKTGEETRAYKLPPVDDEKRTWRYVALVDGILFGSSSVKTQYSDAVFAMDADTGKLLWLHKGKSIRNNAIAIAEGRVMFPDQKATPQQRQEALDEAIRELMQRKGIDAAAAEKELTSADVQVVSALDMRTGRLLWEKPLDLTDCGAHVLSAMANNGVLVFCGSHGNGHYWPQFLGGEYASRRATAVSMADGKLLWSKAIGYRIRPLVVGDLFIAEPWAFDLHTGEQRMRENPVTGLPSPWQFERPGHHCGNIAGSPNGLWFRSWSFAYYDLLNDQGTEHFSGQRPGCWINMIPANGLLVAPEASSGCVCLVSIHATTVWKPSGIHKAWGIFSDPGATMPVKNLRLNLGAPGDRKAPDGKLWLSYPRPSSRMKVDIKADVATLPGATWYSEPGEHSEVANTESPWLYASGCSGLTRLTMPMVRPEDGPAVYTVRLSFADTVNSRPGDRVFDIRMQGQTVQKAFDIIKAAGGPGKAIVMEYKGIRVDDKLSVELVPSAGKLEETQKPVLQALDITRESVLHVGMALPTLTLSDLEPDTEGQVKIGNHTDAEFVGTLQVDAPSTLAVTVPQPQVRLAPGQAITMPLQVKVAKKGPKAALKLALRLLRQDGTVEHEGMATVTYLGPRGRATILASEDTYVSAGAPTINYGHNATFLVDGGESKMGDRTHNIAYLKFPIDVPGKPVSALLRIYVPTGGHTQSSDSGRIKLVTEQWEEYKITFQNRPTPGKEIGSVGKVDQGQWVERKLDVDLTGMKTLSIALDPVNTDGANYVAREGQQKPELVVEFEAAQ